MNFDLKKALRQSDEARNFRGGLIALSVIFAILAGVMIWSIAHAAGNVHKTEARLAEREAETVPPDSVLPDWLYRETAQEAVDRAKENLSNSIFICVMSLLVNGAMVGFFAYRLWQVQHDPDAYDVYEGRLTDPLPAPGRGMIAYNAVFTTRSGKTIKRGTRGIYTKNSLPEYNNKSVLIAYDPVGDRLAVLGRKKDLQYDEYDEYDEDE